MNRLAYYIAICFGFIFVSCQHNYQNELEDLSKKIALSGGKVLYKTNDISDNKHFIVYQNGNNIIINDLEREKILVSDTSKFELRHYFADFLSDGEVIIDRFEPETITLSKKIKDSYFKDIKELDIKCINGEYLFIDSYLICIENPNIVYGGLFFPERLDINGNLVVSVSGDFTRYPNNDYKFSLIDPMLFYRGGCYFSWEVVLDRHGEIIWKGDNISVYDTAIPLNDLTQYDVVERKYMPIIELAMYIINM